jgi:AraC family L-rhamnose operon transcriptional activator RhaR
LIGCVPDKNVSVVSEPSHLPPRVVGLPADPPIRVQEMRDHGEHGLHGHAFHEVVVVTGGAGWHRSRDGRRRLGRGDVLVMAPGQTHAYERTQRLALWNLYYLAPWSLAHLRRLGDEPGLVPLCFATELDPRQAAAPALRLHLDAPALTAVTAELAAIRDEQARPRPSPLLIEACFLKTLTLLARAASAQRAIPDTRRQHPAVGEGLERLSGMVATGGKPALAALARRAGLSPDRFARLFHADTGLSPRAWFQHQRVHRACRLLLDDDRPVTALAQHLGFADGPHFARAFRRVTGFSPTAYRQRFGKA